MIFGSFKYHRNILSTSKEREFMQILIKIKQKIIIGGWNPHEYGRYRN